jgi:hypothetical protein
VAWPVVLWVLTGLALIGALVMGVLAAGILWLDRTLDARGVEASATVIAVDEVFGTVDAEFEANGEPVTVTITYASDPLPAEGDTVTVEYDPADPTLARPAGSSSETVGGVVFLVLAGLGLVVAIAATIGAILLHRARGRAQDRLERYSAQHHGAYGLPGAPASF